MSGVFKRLNRGIVLLAANEFERESEPVVFLIGREGHGGPVGCERSGEVLAAVLDIADEFFASRIRSGGAGMQERGIQTTADEFRHGGGAQEIGIGGCQTERLFHFLSGAIGLGEARGNGRP